MWRTCDVGAVQRGRSAARSPSPPRSRRPIAPYTPMTD